MAVTDKDFEHIIKYVQDTLMVHTKIAVEDIVDIAQLANYESWKSTKTRAKKVVDCVEFQELWDKFPGKASFVYKGKKFTSEQAKRANYQLCKGKYIKILAKGKYTHQQILKAMLVEVETRKIESYKTGKNILHYMNGLEPWLNQEKFEVYIDEEMPEEIKVVVQMESEI
jgi:hypothetical protein